MSEITHHEVSLSEIIKRYSENLSAGDDCQLILLDTYIDAANDKVLLKLYLDDSEKTCKEKLEQEINKLLEDQLKTLTEKDNEISELRNKVMKLEGENNDKTKD